MSLEETKEEHDAIVETSGFSFLLDPRAQVYLENGTIDYRKSIFGEGFSITSAMGGSC